MAVDIKTVLAESQLFQGLTTRDYDKLASIAVSVEFRKGDTILTEGDPALGFYIVAEGLVKVFKVSVDGKEQLLHVFGEGEPVGEVPVFSGTHYPAHVVALTPAVLVYFARDEFTHMLNANPQLALNMLATLSQRLRRFAGVIEDLSLKDVSARLAKYLLSLAKKQQSTSVILPLSKGDLASSLGTISETLSRTLSRLRAAEVVEVARNRIDLLDVETLESIAAGERVL